MLKTVAAIVIVLTSLITQAQATGLFNGGDLTPASVTDLTRKIQPGTILILGEMHGLAPVRDQQMDVLKTLRAEYQGPISVGMEFINYTDQTPLSAYAAGLLPEVEFLKKVNWGGFDFDFYRQQILFPIFENGERVLGLNLSRTITSQIAKSGLESLTPEQQQAMPPNFTIGRNSYRERFFAAMGMHPNPKLENYFVAQSAWDDTMAWRTVEFLKNNPDHVFVIVVGEFHAQFGGGLPDRLNERLMAENLIHPILTLSQIYTEGMTPEDIAQEMKPSDLEGPRGDFIWLSSPTSLQ